MRYTDYNFEVPEEKVIRLIVDTDAKNEADDQFAIVHALLSPKFENVGFIACHFNKEGSMQESYKEINHIFDLMGFPKDNMIYKGALKPLKDLKTPEISEGAKLIIEEAMKDDKRPLYAVFLGAITDLATALLIEPKIQKRLKAIWIGGGKSPTGAVEFNLGNDINAINIVYKSQIELWQVPKKVYELLPISLAELEENIYEAGPIGKYLFEQLRDYNNSETAIISDFRSGETWVIGDSPAIGLLLYEHRFHYELMRAPSVDNNGIYDFSTNNRMIRMYKYIDNRLIINDLFSKIKLFYKKHPDGLNKK